MSSGAESLTLVCHYLTTTTDILHSFKSLIYLFCVYILGYVIQVHMLLSVVCIYHLQRKETIFFSIRENYISMYLRALCNLIYFHPIVFILVLDISNNVNIYNFFIFCWFYYILLSMCSFLVLFSTILPAVVRAEESL